MLRSRLVSALAAVLAATGLVAGGGITAAPAGAQATAGAVFVRGGDPLYGGPLMAASETGGDVRPVGALTGFMPRLSPDGTTVLYVRHDADGNHLRMAAVDGSGDRAITSGNVNDSAPAWSPDGSRIAFARNGGVIVAGRDGSGARQVASGFNPMYLSWSPDGTRLLSAGAPTGGGAVTTWIVNVDGGGQVADSGGPYADWLPDGRIADVRGATLYAHQPGSSSLARLADVPPGYGVADVSPSGSYVLLFDAGSIISPAFKVLDLRTGAISAFGQSTDRGVSFAAGTSAPPTPTPSIPVARVAGADRYATAAEASRTAFGSASNVVVASGRNFPDALAAAPLAAKLAGPVLLVADTVPAPIASEISRLRARSAVIVGGPAAVPDAVAVQLAGMGLTVRRIAGPTRFDTAAAVAAEVGGASGEAILANGGGFADALAAGPLAARARIPVLLTTRDELPAPTRAALASLGARHTIVVGSTAVVSDRVAGQVPGAERLGGVDRYDTAAKVAAYALGRGHTPATLWAATGTNYPDALVAGPVVGGAGNVLVLVDGQNPSGAQATMAFARGGAGQVTTVRVFGSQAAVSDTVAATLAANAS